jgi:hypothetical protein
MIKLKYYYHVSNFFIQANERCCPPYGTAEVVILVGPNTFDTAMSKLGLTWYQACRVFTGIEGNGLWV